MSASNLNDVCAEELVESQSSLRNVSDPRNPPNEMFQASIAISLKRIADALWGTKATTGIVELLNGIEQNGRHG